MSEGSKFRAAVTDMRRNKNFDAIADAIPYAKFLGITAKEQDGKLVSVLEFHETNIGNPVLPAIHGGVVGAFLEMAAIIELMWARETTAVPKPINVTIDYLRPARPEPIYARATFAKSGRRIANVRVEGWQKDPAKPVAAATCNFLLEPDGA